MVPAQISRRTVLGWAALSATTLVQGLGCANRAPEPVSSIYVDPRRVFGPPLRITGGTVVTATGKRDLDVRSSQGRIIELGKGLSARGGERTIDARGLLVLPGGVDPHVHLSSSADEPADRPVDDWHAGTRAALAGGITTVGDMTWADPQRFMAQSIAQEASKVRALALCDAMLHPILPLPTPRVIAELAALIRGGSTSVKVFMGEPVFERFANAYVLALKQAGRSGGLTMIHAEDSALMDAAVQALHVERKVAINYYAESRPTVAELSATQRALAMCELTRAPIYLVHMSSARALEAARDARRRGVPAFVETRPIYLALTDAMYRGSQAALFVVQPPLRTQQDIDALWEGLADGTVDVVASDHVGFSRAQKMAPGTNLTHYAPGVPDLELMLPLLFSLGVATGRLSIERFVALSAENPARLFGLYPRKGTIQVGSDADLALWDPAKTKVVRGKSLTSRAGYTPYEGMGMQGCPIMTIRAGSIAMDARGVIEQRGNGRVLRRHTTQPPHGWT